MAERTIVLDGFSKTFAMTGWRLGYAIVPPSLVQTYGQLIINTISCAPTFAQVGAVEALTRAAGRRRRDGRRVPGPARPHRRRASTRSRASAACDRTGAFYVFPDISGTGLTGAELAERLLHEAGVCVLRRDGVRRRRDEPHPDLVRELAREPDRGARADPGASSSRCVGRARRARVSRDRPRVFVARRIPDDGLAPIRDGAATPTSGPTSCRRRATSCSRAVAGCDGVLTLLTDRVDDELLDAAGPQLKVVSNYAVGFDNIDVAGVHAARDPGRQHARRADRDDRRPRLRAADGGGAPPARGRSLRARRATGRRGARCCCSGRDVHGATLGIVGFGRIGQAVARRARGFGMTVLYHDVAPGAPADGRGGARARRSCRSTSCSRESTSCRSTST